MHLYPQEVIEQVREGNDIVSVVSQYVPLQKRGGYHFGLCPFHRETSPSFSVTESKQIFYCFGCGAGGNVFSFIMRIENCNFYDAVKILAERAHFTLPEASRGSNNGEGFGALKESLYEIHTKAARFYYNNLSSREGSAAVEYLDRRLVSAGVRKKYGLGYSLKGKSSLYKFLSSQGYGDAVLEKSGLVNKTGSGFTDKFSGRLMFPIFDEKNRVVGFGGRILDGVKNTPKYINSPDTPIFNKSRNLYSMNYAADRKINPKTDELILVEGYMDVIALYQYGFKNAVAALGTAFNMRHAWQVKRKGFKSIILLFDSDEAGQKAVMRAIEILRGSGLEIKVLQLAGAKDPDEYLGKFGSESFARAVEGALPYIKFQLALSQKKYGLQNTESKIKFTKDAAQILVKVENAIERDAYIKETAKVTEIDEEAIKYEISKQEELAGFPAIPGGTHIAERNTMVAEGSAKGVDDARRNILQAFAASSAYSGSIASYLQSEEFVIPVYVKLFEVIAKEREKKDTVSIPDLPSFFEEISEQQVVSNIFSAVRFYEDEKKAISDQIKKIKIEYCSHMCSQTPGGNLEQLQFYAQQAKKLANEKFEV